MKCPFMSAKVLGDKGDRFIVGNCIRRECAAWDPQLKYCQALAFPPWGKPQPPVMTAAFLRQVLTKIDNGELPGAIVLMQAELRRLEVKA